MLRIVLAICMGLGAGSALAADFYTELQMARSKNVNKDQVNLSLYSSGHGLGYWGYVQLANTGYEEGYFGAKYRFTDWLEAGVALGGERTAKTEWMQREAGYARLSNDTLSLSAVYENGGTGPWNKFMASYRFTPVLSGGFQQQSFYGRGIQGEYSLEKNLSFTGAALKNQSGLTTLFSIKGKF